MLDPTGAVATCNATNFFVVRDGGVWTSTGHYNLNGITRQVVLEVAPQAGLARPSEVPFSLDRRLLGRGGLRDRHVRWPHPGRSKIDGRPIGDGRPGPVTARGSGASTWRPSRPTW